MDADVPPPNETVALLLEVALREADDEEVSYHLREALQQLIVRREVHHPGTDETPAE